MPIYEYRCTACRHEFEELVRIGDTPPCPSCGSLELERRRSMPAISTSQTRKTALESGRRLGDRARRDKQAADAEYYRKHMHDD